MSGCLGMLAVLLFMLPTCDCSPTVPFGKFPNMTWNGDDNRVFDVYSTGAFASDAENITIAARQIILPEEARAEGFIVVSMSKSGETLRAADGFAICMAAGQVLQFGWLDPKHLTVEMKSNVPETLLYDGPVRFHDVETYLRAEIPMSGSPSEVETALESVRRSLQNNPRLEELRSWMDKRFPKPL